jgi:hypothetical protein
VSATAHALQRIGERLTAPERVALAARIREAVTSHPSGSHAVLVARLGEARGDYWGSNGGLVWAIVRDGVCVTVMLRRDSQPSTPAALQVDRVWRW